MLIELYIDALLVDEELADEVWELWDRGLISDELAAWAWWLLATLSPGPAYATGYVLHVHGIVNSSLTNQG